LTLLLVVLIMGSGAAIPKALVPTGERPEREKWQA